MGSVRTRLAACLFVFVVAAPRLVASCGSSSCPIELHALHAPDERGFSLDLSFQFIDQDQPRAGRSRVATGARASDHAEVRTINRIASLQLGYGVSERLQLLATLPPC